LLPQLINSKLGLASKSLNILYLGDENPNTTSFHRCVALRRLGCNVDVVNPYKFLQPFPRYINRLSYRTGYRLLAKYFLRLIAASLLRNFPHSYDLIWINGGELLGPTVLRWLKQKFQCPVILYQNDDPTGSRDRARFGSLRDAVSLYDLCVCVRSETALELLALGAPRTLRVLMSFDEVQHSGHDDFSNSKPSSSIAFVGTLIPGEGRDQFLLDLIKAGIPLEIRGNNWQGGVVDPLLKAAFSGSGVTGKAYSQALRSASACLGFLSHGNRDLHTTRSVEIPACAGLLCAERTSEHQLLYEEGVEAFFWYNVAECAEQCKILLDNHSLNHKIRSGAYRRVREIGVGNEDICRQILAAI